MGDVKCQLNAYNKERLTAYMYECKSAVISSAVYRCLRGHLTCEACQRLSRNDPCPKCKTGEKGTWEGSGIGRCPCSIPLGSQLCTKCDGKGKTWGSGCSGCGTSGLRMQCALDPSHSSGWHPQRGWIKNDTPKCDGQLPAGAVVGFRCAKETCKGPVVYVPPKVRRRLASAATAAKLAEYEERFSSKTPAE